MTLARRMWLLTEPLHAIVYFAPEHRQAQDAAGLKGGWMAYFASRAAPLGPVPAEVVAAAFYNFEPGMVARAIPDAWTFASPARVLQARYDAVSRALWRILGDSAGGEPVDTALTALRHATEACDVAGRPMFAANLALPWPQEPVAALWHATTLLREFRGDGHCTALLANGIDGCEAHVLAAATGATTVEQLQPNRGWSEEQWQAARARLRARGLVTAAGDLTEQGRAAHAAVDGLTDRLAAPPWEHLGPDGAARLTAAMTPLLDAIEASAVLPYPNPMGLPASRPAGESS